MDITKTFEEMVLKFQNEINAFINDNKQEDLQKDDVSILMLASCKKSQLYSILLGDEINLVKMLLNATSNSDGWLSIIVDTYTVIQRLSQKNENT
ncbi:hypothetical protein KAZ01_01080 [Candidatus Gracilibacteria bacterium]|nr:hypothetical protein [Candidatus Gracilibacteria bacterium]